MGSWPRSLNLIALLHSRVKNGSGKLFWKSEKLLMDNLQLSNSKSNKIQFYRPALRNGVLLS